MSNESDTKDMSNAGPLLNEISDQGTNRSLGLPEAIALLLGIIWALVVVGVYVLTPEAAASSEWNAPLVRILAVMMPVIMLVVAAITLRSARIIREESTRLHAAISSLRHMYLSHTQNAASVADSSLTQKLEEIIQNTRAPAAAPATFQSSRRASDRPAIPEKASETVIQQGSLAFGTPTETPTAPLSNEHFIRAMNFPESADDEDGFVALRLALKDHYASQLIRAAQDILTLLSQDGIYMDDLRPDRARPDVWRQFGQGARGRAIAALGGVRDRSSLALSSGRMKQDPIFRDAAHHFLRRFDQMFTRFSETATDAEISELSNTRTARAFMLLGRVAGTFD